MLDRYQIKRCADQDYILQRKFIKIMFDVAGSEYVHTHTHSNIVIPIAPVFHTVVRLLISVRSYNLLSN